MKTTLKYTVQAVMVAGLLSAGQIYASTDTWVFNSGASQVTPVENAGGVVATVQPGDYSIGWTNHVHLFGSAQGIWDLGSSGKITLNNVSGLVGDASHDRVFTVKVTEWNDGVNFSDVSDVAVPGAEQIGSDIDTTATAALNATTSFGSWVVNETKWHAKPNAQISSAVITGQQYGTVVNQVALVSASSTVAVSPQLTIKMVGGQAVISWPAASSGMTLQASSDLSNPQGWTTVSAVVQTNGDNTVSVTISPAGDQQFYRLKQ